MKHGRHLSNIYDHRKPDARMYHVTDYHTMMSGPKAVEEDWQRRLEWINRNVIGRPQATEKYAVEELEAMGMIGIYAPADAPPQPQPKGEK